MLVNDQNNSKTGSCTESLEDVLVSKYPDHVKYLIQSDKARFSCEISSMTYLNLLWLKTMSELFYSVQIE